MTEPRPRHEVATDVDDIRADLEFERQELERSIRHDYSTSDTGIVPLDRRRPMWHFAGLWTTFVAGFSYMVLGFEIHDGGYGLAATVGITVLGYGLYVVYALLGSYLGSRTGQTHSLLTRSIFGSLGSAIVSLFVLIAPLGWVGFQAGLLAQLWHGFYGWGHVEAITIILAAVMILNNLLGFTGISVFARYLVTPILIVWCIYLVLKGFITDSGNLGGTPGGNMPFWVAVGAAIGFSMWGNEPDFWRYGKPRFTWPLPTFIIATISQFAINDGNYYESVNAGQNLLGGWRQWRRLYTCVAVAGGGALAAWIVNYKAVNGWFDVATFLAITVPCATVIMTVDHFVLPGRFRISRPLLQVPSWQEAGRINIPAVISLLVAVAYGAIASAILPGNLGYDSARNWGPVPLECWAIAGALYAALVAAVRTAPNLKRTLAFSRPALQTSVPPGAVVDVASEA